MRVLPFRAERGINVVGVVAMNGQPRLYVGMGVRAHLVVARTVDVVLSLAPACPLLAPFNTPTPLLGRLVRVGDTGVVAS